MPVVPFVAPRPQAPPPPDPVYLAMAAATMRSFMSDKSTRDWGLDAHLDSSKSTKFSQAWKDFPSSKNIIDERPQLLEHAESMELIPRKEQPNGK